jgi:hypothetical protein
VQRPRLLRGPRTIPAVAVLLGLLAAGAFADGLSRQLEGGQTAPALRQAHVVVVPPSPQGLAWVTEAQPAATAAPPPRPTFARRRVTRHEDVPLSTAAATPPVAPSVEQAARPAADIAPEPAESEAPT